jgi:amino acid transporter
VLVEGGFAMLLVVAGGFAQSGFNAMVDYMTPIYWLFIVLSMGALMILRHRHPDAVRPVRTPLYPLFPGLFMAISIYMFVAGMADLGPGALYGAGVMLVGGALLLLLRLAPGGRVVAVSPPP